MYAVISSDLTPYGVLHMLKLETHAPFAIVSTCQYICQKGRCIKVNKRRGKRPPSVTNQQDGLGRVTGRTRVGANATARLLYPRLTKLLSSIDMLADFTRP